MLDNLNKNGKNSVYCGCVFLLITIIVFGAGMASGGSAGKVDFVLEQQTSGSWTVAQSHCDGSFGYSLHTDVATEGVVCNGDENDGDISDRIQLSPDYMSCDTRCKYGLPVTDEWAKEKSLTPVCEIHLFNAWDQLCRDDGSTLSFDSPAPLYVLDTEKEIGEAVSGIMGAILFMLLAVAFLVTSLCLFCIPCCCCKAEAGSGGAAQ